MSQPHYCSNERPCPAPPHPHKEHHHKGEHRAERPLGLNDGTLFPPSEFPEDTPSSEISSFAQTQSVPVDPINILIVLVNFTNKSIDSEKVQYFKNLFFSPNEFPAVDYMQTDENKKPYTSNSVTNYYSEVSGGLISFTGDVIGPYTLDHPIEWYANGCYGGASPPSWGLKKTNDAWGDIRTMGADALDKVIAANEVDLKKYDNKGRFHGYIDAFIVVHAGDGGEDHILNFLPGPEKDHTIWSCKWVLPGNDPREVKTKSAQTVKISPFLTVPETAKLGVCCHEVGHLVFGWPDLYDIGSTSRHGIGPWCLMAEGCWGGNPNDSAHNVPGGSVPCHPSAWCKNNAGWVKAIQPTSSGSISLSANVIKAGTTATLGGVEKLWTNGDAASKEYFLLENRQKAGFDKYLPGTGLLVWHVDDGLTSGNSESNTSSDPHYHVSLVDASGATEITAWGSPDTPFPGGKKITSFTSTTNPNSKSYAGTDTFVSVTGIPSESQTMPMQVGVSKAS